MSNFSAYAWLARGRMRCPIRGRQIDVWLRAGYSRDTGVADSRLGTFTGCADDGNMTR
jgi:hypothetical protein